MAAAEQTDYQSLLADPRWQRRRLEVLERAGWRCTRCHNENKQLHVHHRQYIYGRMPWEYSDDELVVLCDDCHGLEHEPEPTDEDIRREATIEKLQHDLVVTPDSGERRQIMAAIQSLVASRSPEQVRRMERDRGLR
jgi:5-methylcytosine-specific restriction endonuclease McrA